MTDNRVTELLLLCMFFRRTECCNFVHSSAPYIHPRPDLKNWPWQFRMYADLLLRNCNWEIADNKPDPLHLTVVVIKYLQTKLPTEGHKWHNSYCTSVYLSCSLLYSFFNSLSFSSSLYTENSKNTQDMNCVRLCSHNRSFIVKVRMLHYLKKKKKLQS